jgi:glutamyl-Q tRNA(Asp) synthetase
MTSEPARYVGRFAPSPTGPLHFGSLLAAVASYGQALISKGRWLIRIEDIDPPREQPGADELIINMLDAFGFEWDGQITYQSTFTPRHEALVARLVSDGLAYPCSCSRRTLADVPRGPLGAIYPGTCRNGCVSGDTAIRVLVDDAAIEFEDLLQGHVQQRLQSESGDFIIKRRDGLIAYHMAVAVDDFDQGITEIVRGVDLLDSTPRQIHLQRLLGFTTPSYVHIPVAVGEDGDKLSKLTGAAAITSDDIGASLYLALKSLRQQPPEELARAHSTAIWSWVAENWDLAGLQGQTEISASLHRYG